MTEERLHNLERVHENTVKDLQHSKNENNDKVIEIERLHYVMAIFNRIYKRR